jgi:hypothetical protein
MKWRPGGSGNQPTARASLHARSRQASVATATNLPTRVANVREALVEVGISKKIDALVAKLLDG